ncbi:Os05g0384450 [Oryza sativa Japonica Group]|uniref:Os05g0384450 protein n=1 Tax=Oryza sativa subsp. japonica TaxID=39947 RepID=A0A0P0WLT2_ORYSJ|nr:Os05g0384450 [Oryza sativa Japonica Group]
MYDAKFLICPSTTRTQGRYRQTGLRYLAVPTFISRRIMLNGQIGFGFGPTIMFYVCYCCSRLQGSGVLHAKIDGDYYQAFDMEDWHVCWDGYGFLGKLARDYVTFMILSHWNTMFLNADDAGARTSAERQRPISSSSGEPARQPA